MNIQTRYPIIFDNEALDYSLVLDRDSVSKRSRNPSRLSLKSNNDYEIRVLDNGTSELRIYGTNPLIDNVKTFFGQIKESQFPEAIDRCYWLSNYLAEFKEGNIAPERLEKIIKKIESGEFKGESKQHVPSLFESSIMDFTTAYSSILGYRSQNGADKILTYENTELPETLREIWKEIVSPFKDHLNSADFPYKRIQID